ncbi:MAG: glutathione S-transferase C-terminal domain-containing protein [Polyangiaceae bacterium]
MKTTFVDLETAKATPGLRLVTVAGAPSPWSEAAKAIFHFKKVPFVAVRRLARDEAMQAWTSGPNAPVALFDAETPRSGWADILALAERLAPAASLVPSNPGDRVRMYGLANEVLGEGGLVWSFRALTIAEGLASEGVRGFSVPVARYLAKRYVDSPERTARASARVVEALDLLARALGDKTFYFGDAPTALDFYSAAALHLLSLMPEEKCPMDARLRAAFESMASVSPPVALALAAHRDLMLERYFEMPLVL